MGYTRETYQKAQRVLFDRRRNAGQRFTPLFPSLPSWNARSPQPGLRLYRRRFLAEDARLT